MTRVASTIAEFTAADLDAFGDPLFSTEFLGWVEADHGSRADTLYFHLRDRSGLRAFASGYVYRTEIPFTFRLEEFLAASDLVPANGYLVVNAPIRLRSRVLAVDGAAQRELIAGIVDWARSTGLGGVVLPFALGSDTALAAGLAAAGFVSAFYEGDFYLPLPRTSTLEEFLVALDAGPRKQFRNDINRLGRSATRIHPVAGTLDAYADTLALQHANLMKRYARPHVELTAGSFRRFADHVVHRHVAIAEEDGRCTAFAISSYGHGIFHLLRYGRDAQTDEHARVYANIVYTESVRRALELGCHRVHFGKASHRAKILRGCRYEEGIAHLLLFDADRQAAARTHFADLDVANRRRFASRCHPESGHAGAPG